MEILGAYRGSMGHIDKKQKAVNELMSQEDKVNEQQEHAQGMANKITELQSKKKITINTQDGRTLLT